MAIYKLCSPAKGNTESKAVLRFNDDGSITSIPFSETNADYQSYLKWLEEGNVPEPAEE
jgi:hypothetical protein